MEPALPNCDNRGCKYLVGVFDDDDPAHPFRCRAFPKGIPFSIAYGDDKHDKVVPGQTGTIVFEKGEPVDEV